MPESKPLSSSTQIALFDLPEETAQLEVRPAPEPQPIPENNYRMLSLLVEMGCNKDIIITMLESFYSLTPKHSQYLGGANICGKTGWTDTTPQWLFRAIALSRLEQVCQELSQGEIGYLATPAEVLTVIYSYSLEAPLGRDWADVYFWCCSKVIPRFQARILNYPEGKGLRTEKEYWKFAESSPIPYRKIQYSYEQIAADIRGKIIEDGRSKGYGKKIKAGKAEPKLEEPSTEQMSLL